MAGKGGIKMTRKKTLLDTNSENKHSDDTLTLLRQIVSQNEQIIQLLTKLKERFI